MILLDTLKVYHRSESKLIELYSGDLTDLSPEEAVDVLVVSAFSGDYAPTYSSLIGALYRKGLSVDQLARSKALDLRETFSCWMSQEIEPKRPGLEFKRLVCFESPLIGTAASRVGDIFQALAACLGDENPLSTVAMPIVASGNQGYRVSEMLPPLLDAAVHWMALDHPLKRLKIVAYTDSQAGEAQALFAKLKGKYRLRTTAKELNDDLFISFAREGSRGADQQFKYDVFISYAHEDLSAASFIAEELQRLQPRIQIFMDRMSINVGAAWQPEIFEAIDACKKVLTLFSPSYLNSKVCKEEFNIAWVRSREAEKEFVYPIFLLSTSLPTYMKYRLYVDCREGDENKLRRACAELVSALAASR